MKLARLMDLPRMCANHDAATGTMQVAACGTREGRSWASLYPIVPEDEPS
jgi:hypothetical protein